MGVSPNYVTNNTPLEEVMEIKDLGVCFDSLLVFDKHTSETRNTFCGTWYLSHSDV